MVLEGQSCQGQGSISREKHSMELGNFNQVILVNFVELSRSMIYVSSSSSILCRY